MKKSFLIGALALVLAFGFIGCDDGSNGSTTPPPPPHDGNVLTVTGIPGNVTITVAVVLSTGISPAPVAIAFNEGGTFNFFEPIPGPMPLPSTNPWKGTGAFPIILSTGFDEAAPFYTYTQNSGEYTFNGSNTGQTAAFTNFMILP